MSNSRNQTKRPPATPRDLVARPTAMALALVDACEKAGIDVSSARLPVRREPAWRVSKREEAGSKKGRRR